MSLFKRRSRLRKAVELEQKQDAYDKPKPEPYEHVPKHAAADAAVNSGEKSDQGNRLVAKERRMSKEASNYAMGSAAERQSVAHTAMNSTPPSSLAGKQRGFKDMFGLQKNKSAPAAAAVLTTEAPPMPKSTAQQPGKSILRSSTPRNDNSNCSEPFDAAPSSSISPAAGSSTTQFTAREHAYVNPHYSGDSGYGSVGDFRTPSEHFLAEINGPHLPRINSGFPPELSLSQELAREPAFSEQKLGRADPVEQAPRKGAPDSVLKTGERYLERQASQLDLSSLNSTKPGKGFKQTRFEQAPETVGSKPATVVPKPQEDAAWHLTQRLARKEPERRVRPDSATLPQPQVTVPVYSSTAQSADYKEPAPLPIVSGRHSTRQPFVVPQSQYSVPACTSTPPPTRAREVEPHMPNPERYVSPPPQSNYVPLQRTVSGDQQSVTNAPPVSRLEGFKVNKRGNVLDEEGELIGELYEGDIMDCVRQRANGSGEVLDDYGSVVGRVRSLGRNQGSPISRMSSPEPFQHQQQQNLSHGHQVRPMSSALSLGRREWVVSQPDAFTPAWQQHLHNAQPVFAHELQRHLASAPQDTIRAPVHPIDLPDNFEAVELPATQVEHVLEEETLPVFDHSDIFLPTPSVPAKSPRRPEGPLSQLEKQQPTRMNQELLQEQSKHVYAPVPTSQQSEQPRHWAAASVINTLPDEPQQTVSASTQTQPQAHWPLVRSPSESSLSDLSNSYAQPTMSPVPEDGQLTGEDRSPALFSYKGDVPATDGRLSDASLAPLRAIGTKPPPPSFPHQVLSGGTPVANSVPYSSAGAVGAHLAPSGRATTSAPGPRPTLNTRYSSSAPIKRSPLSNHETTPSDSGSGSVDRKRIDQAHGGQSRLPSLQTKASQRSLHLPSGKPCAYFTHAGNANVIGEQDTPAPVAAAKTAAQMTTVSMKPAAPSVLVKGTSKRSRFGLGFGKRTAAAAR
ncbi:hypothetical protein LTR08_006630 [Meristemomyces frigidus]|nr:hypothetical protein LTR08_006630 [Meristemomyces frigidus]